MVLLDESKQLSSRTILNNKDNIFLSLECILQIDDKRMFGLCHDIPLIHDDIFFLVFDDHLFINHLHCIEIVINFGSA